MPNRMLFRFTFLRIVDIKEIYLIQYLFNMNDQVEGRRERSRISILEFKMQ